MPAPDSTLNLRADPRPPRDRPLNGHTILAVEDSRFTCDALRLMSLASGARLRRADCLASARRHLAIYRPSVVIVDMGLPDGSGAELICELASQHAHPPTLAISGDPDQRSAAEAAGCSGFVEKPFGGLGAFQQAVLSTLPADQCPRGPRALPGGGEDAVHPDPLALKEDLSAAAGLLAQSPSAPDELAYAAQFTRALARSANDAELWRGAQALSRALDGRASGVTASVRWLSRLLRQRLHSHATTAFGA